jgi:hypothetical protein
METYPAHWVAAAAATDIRLSPGHLLKLPPGRDQEYLYLTFRIGTDRPGTWATMSLMVDFLSPSYLEKQLGLRPGAIHQKTVIQKYIDLCRPPIPQEDFHKRYPEVPSDQAHQFVLLHEFGHAVDGVKEADADRYAFSSLLLREDPKQAQMRSLWYEKMPAPDTFKWHGVPLWTRREQEKASAAKKKPKKPKKR